MNKLIVYIANRIWVVLGIYVASLLLAAWMFSVFEGKPFSDGCWWAAVSSLTIGYDDISPVTMYGRLVGVFFGHFWVFAIVPMVICNIIIHLIEDKNEFTDGEQRELFNRIKNIEKLLLAIKNE